MAGSEADTLLIEVSGLQDRFGALVLRISGLGQFRVQGEGSKL